MNLDAQLQILPCPIRCEHRDFQQNPQSQAGAVSERKPNRLPSATNPIQPLIGVVTRPFINGMDFFQSRSGVGMTPLLIWSPPLAGSVSHYSVYVWQLSNNGGNTAVGLAGYFSTQSTSLRIPPGILKPGLGYAFQINAVTIPCLNFSKTPFQLDPTFGTTDVISGMQQP